MDIELINQDIVNYYKKYTRFMSKKIYITKKMYDKFTSLYDYIYDDADDSIINYNENEDFKKLLKIKEKGYVALKLHNQKILNDLYSKYSCFLDDSLLKREKLAIMCGEDKVVIPVKDNNKRIKILENKVDYLINVEKVKPNKICVIGDDSIYSKYNRNDIDVFSYYDFAKKLMGSGKKNISFNDRCVILGDYIQNVLFKDKKKFSEVYDAFSIALLFNEDAMQFETFKDYHTYMFQRSFLNSKKSKEDFVKSRILFSRNRLFGIDGIKYPNEIMVDIANCLWCSGVSYKYINNNNFDIYNDDIHYKLVYIDGNYCNKRENDIIYLYSNYNDDTSCIGHLIYELVKRRYPIEKKNYDEIYLDIKSSTIDEYYIDFIMYIVMPFIKLIEENNYSDDYIKIREKELSDNNDKKRFKVLLWFYDYYKKYREENNLIDDYLYLYGVSNKVHNLSYSNIIIDDSTSFLENYKIDGDYKFNLFILTGKENILIPYLTSNIKLFCDFKEYLAINKIIPIASVYYGLNEIDNIAYRYTEDNVLKVCNIYGDVMTYKKKVFIYLYDDSNYLLDNYNSNYLVKHILSCKKINDYKKVMIIGRNENDYNNLSLGDFMGVKNKKVIIGDNMIDYLNMDDNNMKVYDSGVLVWPMDSKNCFKYDSMDYNYISILNDEKRSKYEWERKLFYMAISRVKNNLYVVLAKSRAYEFVKFIANHNEVSVKKEIYKVNLK